MNIHAVRDVFTPSSIAGLTFVERNTINDKLVDALRTRGKQLVVYGHSGCGKTTLLEHKLKQLFSVHIKTSCMKGMTFEQILADPLHQLNAMYTSEQQIKDTSKFSLGSGGAMALPVTLGLEFSAEGATKNVAIAPQTITPHKVAEVLGTSKACWVLEDFHKVDASEKVKLSQCMKMFVDLSERYPDLKMIFIGAVNSAREVVEYDLELRNRVSEVNVPLMTDSELRDIIGKGEQCLNISIDSRIVDRIIAVSNGLAAVSHQIALNFCNARGIEETQPSKVYLDTTKWIQALERYLEESSDTLRAVFDKSVKNMKKRKYDHGRVILKALTKAPQTGATHQEILQNIRVFEPAYPAANLGQHLKALLSEDRCSILTYDEYSGNYYFSEPVHRAFCYMLFESEGNSKLHVGSRTISMAEFLKTIIPEMAEKIAQLEARKNGDTTGKGATQNNT